MGRVKQVPCLSCRLFTNCQKFFVKRKNEYDEDRDLGEDYNSESILELGRQCNVLKDYLFLDEVSFPSRNDNFFWWPAMENKISENAWIARMNLFRDIWQMLYPLGSM